MRVWKHFGYTHECHFVRIFGKNDQKIWANGRGVLTPYPPMATVLSTMCVRLSVCLSVRSLSQKVFGGFPQNFDQVLLIIKEELIKFLVTSLQKYCHGNQNKRPSWCHGSACVSEWMDFFIPKCLEKPSKGTTSLSL